MSTPLLGRDARIFLNGDVIGFCKNISLIGTAQVIKEYAIDQGKPALLGAGNQDFMWSAERLFTDATYIDLLLSGEHFELAFLPDGNINSSWLIEALENCVLTSSERVASETGAVLEKLSGSGDWLELPEDVQ